MRFWCFSRSMQPDNWHIIGHEWATDYLQRCIVQDRVAHAYLIVGPAGVGKALLALRIAQVLNCEQQNPAPCLTCRSCRRIEHGNHPDVRIAGMDSQAAGLKQADAARQKDLKIDTVRQWQRDIALRPYDGRRRIFILHDAERLNEEASNAMLKTLEEPPPFATLVLVANTASLLTTVVSRCQMLRLRPLPRPQISQALVQQHALDQEHADVLAAWSAGRIGWAFDMATDPAAFQAYQDTLDHLLQLHTQPISQALSWAEDRSKEYRSGNQALVLSHLERWQNWWRDVMLVSAGCYDGITHVDRLADLERAARLYALAESYRFVVRLDETTRQLRENVNPQLALENLLLHLPGR